MTTTLTLANRTSATTTLQVRPFLWTQGADVDVLVPTAQLSVSPPMANIAPGEVQIFRLVLRRAAASIEDAYRVLIDQLPPPATPGTVRVALRFSVPIFARPSSSAAPESTWRIAFDETSALLVGTNRGTAHVRIDNPVLASVAGMTHTLVCRQPPYILPGASRSWTIEGSRLQPGSVFRLTASSDAGPIHAMVSVPGP